MNTRLARRLLLDFLLPLLIFAFAARQMVEVLPQHLDDMLGASTTLEPTDSNGTIWFYWWVHQAYTQGRDLLNPDVICHPGGQNLGSNFPNRIDALFALPFFHLFPFPRSYNLAILAGPVASALAAYACFRRLSERRSLALAGGFFFGFQAYSFAEITAGRPVTGLVVVLPLFLYCWLTALEGRRWGFWALLAGFAGSLAVQDYIPFALFLLVFAVGSALLRLFWPAEGASRLRPFGVGLITAIFGAFFSAPYVHETLLVRLAGPASAMNLRPVPMAELWEPRLWTDLYKFYLKLGEASTHVFFTIENRAEVLSKVQAAAMPWDWLWHIGFGESGKRAFFPPESTLVIVLVGLLGGRRSWAWLAGALVFWVITLGPYAAETVDLQSQHLLLIGGQKVALPLSWLVHYQPALASFIRAYRASPLFLFCLCGALVSGADRLLERGRSWAGPNGWRVLSVHAAALGGTLLLANYTAMMLKTAHWTALPSSPWHISPFIEKMASDREEYAVAELPIGIGHGSALLQVVHGKQRSEGHHDELARLALHRPPPKECYTLPFLQALWYLGGKDGGATVEEGFRPEAIASAVRAGFRYVLLYPKAYQGMVGRNLGLDQAKVEAELQARLGAPVYQDSEVVVYALPGGG